MNLAQISLRSYFLAELQFSANGRFDVTMPHAITIDDYEVVPRTSALAEDRRTWQTDLRVALPERFEKNFPCSFAIELSGVVDVAQSVGEEYIDRFVNINGVALLYGVAREMIRTISAAGPADAIVLPSVTFWEPNISATSNASTAPSVGGAAPAISKP